MKIGHNGKPKRSQTSLELLTTSLDSAIASRPWLSNSHLQTLLRGATAAEPAAREAFSHHLRALLLSDQPPRMSKRSLQLACAFVGISPAAVASSSFERVRSSHGQRATSAATGFAQNLARGLRQIAEAQSQGDLDTPQKAQAFADQALRSALSERGVLHDATVSLQLPAEHFALINNQRGVKESIAQVAAFLAQMAKDHGGRLRLEVQLVPKEGALTKSSRAEGDVLLVPLSRGLRAAELRREWSEGAFIRPRNALNPFDHLRTSELRSIWRLGLDPVGQLRTGLRRVFGRAAKDLGRSIDRVAGSADLQTHAPELVRRFVSADATTDDGQPLRHHALERFAAMDTSELRETLARWQAVISDDELAEALGEAVAGVALDHQTHDIDPALARHAKDAMKEISPGGRRGLINFEGDDVVTVMPNLARRLFGGASLERTLRG